MTDSEDFLRRLSEGDQQAVEELVVELTPMLKRFVRRHLDRLRVPFDRLGNGPSDIVSEVWYRFFAKRCQLRPWESIRLLTKFLQGMGKNVVREQARSSLRTRMRDIRREMPVEQALLLDDAALLEIITPFDEVVRLELYERLLQCVPAGLQSIVQMLLAGHGCEEVSEVTGLSRTIVRRIHARVMINAMGACG